MRDQPHIADRHRPGRARAAIGLLLLAGLLAIGVASTGAGASPATPAGTTARSGAAAVAMTDPGTAEQEFVAQINQLRSSRGLSVLSVDGALTDQARAWAANMRDAGRIYHAPDLSIGVDPNWLKLGENVGVGGDTGSLFQAFVNSPTHLENLVDGVYTHVGVGVVISADGTRMFTAHRFMALGAPAPPTTQPPRAPVTTAPLAAPPPTAPPTTAAPTTTVPVETTTTTTTAAPAPAPKLGPIAQLADLIDPD